jgi:hypothetical protein
LDFDSEDAEGETDSCRQRVGELVHFGRKSTLAERHWRVSAASPPVRLFVPGTAGGVEFICSAKLETPVFEK